MGAEDGGQSGMCFVRNWQVSAVTVIVAAISQDTVPVTVQPLLTDRLIATPPRTALLKGLSANKRQKLTVSLLFNYAPRHDSYRKMEVESHPFLTSALDRGEWRASYNGRFNKLKGPPDRRYHLGGPW